MNNKISTPKIELGYMSIITILFIFIFFLISDQTNDLVPIQDTAFPAYIVSLLSALFLVGYIYKFGIPKSSIRNVFLCLLLYFTFLFIYSLFQMDIEGIRISTKAIVYGSILFLIGFTKWNKLKLLIIAYMFSIFTLIILFHWLQVREIFTYEWFFHNPNTLGIFIYCVIFIHFLALSISKNTVNRVIFGLLLIIDLLLLYVSSSRGTWLALGVSILFIIICRYITLNKIFYNLSFFTIIFGVLFFSYVYPKLYTTELGEKIDYFLYTYTGKSFFSGRQDIWLQLLYAIEQKPLLGYGISTSASDFLIHDFTAHNMYLSTLLESGLIGLLLYCVLLYSIWNSLYPNKNLNKDQRNMLKLFIGFFAGLLIYQCFEMAFFQGPYSINILEWLILSIGIGVNLGTIRFQNNS